MKELQAIRPGQVWREKKRRWEYTSRRILKVVSLGEEAFSHQPGKAEITQVQFAIWAAEPGSFWVPGDEVWQDSKRTMYAFGLRKNWYLVKDAPYVLCLLHEPLLRCYGATDLDAHAAFDHHVYDEHMSESERKAYDYAWEHNGEDIPPEEFMPVDIDDERERCDYDSSLAAETPTWRTRSRSCQHVQDGYSRRPSLAHVHRLARVVRREAGLVGHERLPVQAH